MASITHPDVIDAVNAIVSFGETMAAADVSVDDLVQFLPCAIEEGWAMLEVQVAMLSTAMQRIKKAGGEESEVTDE